jgi:type II secretory pathway component PulF
MSNGNCPIGAAHAQQIRLLEENVERLDDCLSLKADAAYLTRIEAKVDKLGNMFWGLITLIIANLIGIILMLLRSNGF